MQHQPRYISVGLTKTVNVVNLHAAFFDLFSRVSKLARFPFDGKARRLEAEFASLQQRKHAEADDAAKRIWRLRREISDLHRAIEEGWAHELPVTPWDGEGYPPEVPLPEAPASVHLVHARRQLAAVLEELEFRTRIWREAVEAGQPHHPYDHGFVLPKLHARETKARKHHRKIFRCRPMANGLTARQAFSLEARCLMRLQELGELARFFPAPLTFAPAEPSITTVHVGRSLDNIFVADRARLSALISASYLEQIDGVISALKRGKIVHLDLLINGRNVVLGEDGRLSLVDFDIAVIDDHPFSAEIQRRYREWNAGGGYERTRRQLVASVEHFLGRAPREA